MNLSIDSEGKITSASDCPQELVIPPKLTTARGVTTITAIGAQAFANKGIKKVVLPNTVKRVFKYAFANNDITEIEIEAGDKLWALDDHSFAGNVNLKSVTLPSNITYIGIFAFADCPQLCELNAHNVNTIAHDAFKNCGFSDGFKLPAYVTKIGANAFAGNNIKEITLSPFLESIQGNAFGDVETVHADHVIRHLYQNAFGKKVGIVLCPEEKGSKDFIHAALKGDEWRI